MPAPSTALRESPRNLLPLEEWRHLLGFHPFMFWGQANSQKTPISSACNQLVYEYAWQNADAVGRHEIRDAIHGAENKLTQHLGYAPAPHYVIESVPFPRYPDARLERNGYGDVVGRWMTVQLSEGYVQDVGVETLTLLGNPEITYLDTDGDGLNDTFSVTVPTTVTDPEEIAAYFAAADRLDNEPAGERWRIAPVTVTIAGGVATIRGRAWMLARPLLYQGVSSEAIDPTDASKFAVTLEVYRRYTSAGTTLDTAQAVLVWETRPWPDWAVCTGPTTSTDAAGEAYALARVGLRDARLGIVTIGESVYNATTETWALAGSCGAWCRPPDRVIVRYRAGYPTEAGRVAAIMRPVIARLAAAELARPVCGCESANRELYRWQFDLSRAAGANDEQYAVSSGLLNCPLGTSRGAWEAWKFIEDQQLGRGFAI